MKTSYKCDINYKENIDEFDESKVFANKYFYKTHIQWNNLPLELRIVEDYDTFTAKLNEFGSLF